MKVKYLAKGTKCYAQTKANEYKEIVIERIDLLSIVDDNATVFYNGNEDLTNDVLVDRNENEFAPIKDFQEGYLANDRTFWVCTLRGVEKKLLRVCDIEYLAENGCHIKSTKWEDSDGNRYSKAFNTKALAVESREVIVNNLDGSTEIIPGLLSLMEFEPKQLELLGKLNSLIGELQDNGVTMVLNDSWADVKFINTKNVEVRQTFDERWDEADDQLCIYADTIDYVPNYRPSALKWMEISEEYSDIRVTRK